MGLSRCPWVAWQRQAQNLSVNMLAHTSTENHQIPTLFHLLFSCSTGGWIPDLGHTVQVPYHWPIAPALHNASSGYACVGQWDSSVEKKVLAAKPNDPSSTQRTNSRHYSLTSTCVPACVHTQSQVHRQEHTHTLQFGSEMSPAGSCFKCFISGLQGSFEVCRTFRRWHLIGTVRSYFNVRLTHPFPARLSQVLPVWRHVLLRLHP